MRKLIGFTPLLLLAACGSLWAQPYGPYGPTDGFTQTSVAPGTPAGSYALMGVDNINYYNCNLNVTLPLFHVGGRGKAGYDIVLPLERKWRIQQYITDNTPSFVAISEYLPTSPYWGNYALRRYTPGKMIVRPSVDMEQTLTCTTPIGGYF